MTSTAADCVHTYMHMPAGHAEGPPADQGRRACGHRRDHILQVRLGWGAAAAGRAGTTQGVEGKQQMTGSFRAQPGAGLRGSWLKALTRCI